MIQIAGLIRETFLEAIAKKVLIGFFIIAVLVLAGIAWYFFNGDVQMIVSNLRPSPDDPNGIALREMLYSNQMMMGLSFNTVAVFIAIFLTAHIIPSMLERGTIDLLLSKPISRTKLLFSKAFAGFLVAASCMVFFTFGSWIITSVATGIWNTGYLLSLLPILLEFLSLYSLLVFIGLLTQSAALGMIITYVLAVVIIPLLANRTATLFQLIQSDFWQSVITGIYKTLPQVGEIHEISIRYIVNKPIGDLYPLGSAAAFALVFFLLSALVFHRKEF